MTYYFAYGSNMNPARMQARGLRVEEALAGRLAGYALCFNKRAHDHPGRGYANIRHQAGAVVEGVLYRLAGADEILKMDPFEGTPVYYSRECMLIDSARGPIAAWLYVANPAWRAEGLAPSVSYLNHLLAGRELLSADYWAALAATAALDD
ncbi:gamma-glutamylcyclotransferase family protein [Pseudomonas sp. BMS12]|uniref:gamma-glutamylcyclotransferase family protein n=1 Tax=Pseudomonas sp. BMS12 TaxID=1796033 RepID=UPI00083AE6F9|nr:gamma-glutamylcyclotransferase family protein [Pseudomonas sp. BMS12]